MAELYVFPHSHYCEAARWALDWKGIAYKATPLLPGPHLVLVRRIAPKSSLPVLLMEGDVVQGSREIMDYLDERFPQNPLAPASPAERAEAARIEADVDQHIGVPLRAVIYERLIHYHAPMKYCFTHGMPAHKKLLFSLSYPYLKRRIRDTYVRDPAYIADAKATLLDAIARFDDVVAQRTFLVGERLSRADIMVAAMLSIGVFPKEHPFPWPDIDQDEALTLFRRKIEDSATFEWVRRIYRDHRGAGAEFKAVA